MTLQKLPYEKQLKLIDIAGDIMDRDGWITGQLHGVMMKNPLLHDGEVECVIRTDVQSLLAEGWVFTNDGVLEHCAIGAMEQALVEDGVVDALADNEINGYSLVEAAFGLDYESEITKIVRANDRSGGGRKEAIEVAKRIVKRNCK